MKRRDFSLLASGAAAASHGVARLIVGMLAASCARKPDAVIHAADGQPLGAEDVDRRPLWLLPPGAVAWLQCDVSKASQTALGSQLLRRLVAGNWLPPQAVLRWPDDVERFWLAGYGETGVDAAAVLRGKFEPSRLRQAAESAQLARRTYAGRDTYHFGSGGMALLTRRTAIAGSERSLRRCLDRVAERRAAFELPDWVAALMVQQGAHFAGGVDPSAGAIASVISSRFPAFAGVRRASWLGNLGAERLNLVATLSTEPGGGAALENALRQATVALNAYSQVLGAGPALTDFQTRVTGAAGADVELAATLPARAVLTAVDRALPGVRSGLAFGGAG